MNSFHRGDWLSLAQSVATLVAIVGAFAVAIYQDRAQTARTERVASRDRLRERFRAAAYSEALLGNVLIALNDVIGAADTMIKHGIVQNGDYALDSPPLQEAVLSLASALQGSLPTEVMKATLDGLAAARQAVHAIQRTSHIKSMRIVELRAFLFDQKTAIDSAETTVKASRVKWQQRLASDESL